MPQGRGGRKRGNGGKRGGSTRQIVSDRVGEEEDDDGPGVTNADDLKRKLPSASKTSTVPEKKFKKAKGYVDLFSKQSRGTVPTLQLVPEPPFSVADSERNLGGSTSIQKDEYISSPRTINTTLRPAAWMPIIDPDLDAAPVSEYHGCQQQQGTVDESVTHTVAPAGVKRPSDATLGSPFHETPRHGDCGCNHGGSMGTWSDTNLK